MAARANGGRGRLLEPAHGIEPLLAGLMVPFQPIIHVLRASMVDPSEEGTQRGRGAFRLIRDHMHRRDVCLADGAFEDGLCGLGLAPRGEVRIDHWPILVDRPVNLGPGPVQANIGFIDPPAVAEWSSRRTGSVLEQGEKVLNPPLDGAAIHAQPALGEPLHHIRVAEAIAHVPADGHRDHIIRECMMRKGARRARGEAPTAGVTAPPLTTQRSLSISSRLLASASHTLHDQPFST